MLNFLVRLFALILFLSIRKAIKAIKALFLDFMTLMATLIIENNVHVLKCRY